MMKKTDLSRPLSGAVKVVATSDTFSGLLILSVIRPPNSWDFFIGTPQHRSQPSSASVSPSPHFI
jgi:hypothetical protein